VVRAVKLMQPVLLVIRWVIHVKIQPVLP